MNTPTSRREFLERSAHTSAVLAAATGLGGVTANAAEKPEPVRLGIIGCGGIMTLHVKGLVSRGEEVSIGWLCDVDPGQMGSTASAPQSGRAVRDERLDTKMCSTIPVSMPYH